MTSPVRHALSFILLVSVAAAGSGCSQDTVNGGSQGLNVVVRPNPAGAGRFERASMLINKIQFLPADPATAALYGSERLLMKFTPYDAQLAATQDQLFSNVSISAGTYRVTYLEVAPLVLVDEDLAPPPYATCIDGLAIIDGSTPCTPDPQHPNVCVPDVPTAFGFNDPPNLSFTIQPGQTTLALKVNIPGLIAGYQSMYTCTLGCGTGGAPCLTAFNEATYRAAVLANISFE
jgi:hypothetical protein